MWTKPAHFTKWLPPAGFDMTILKGEIRAGSGIFFRMSSAAAGITMYGRLEYLKIERPNCIAYVQDFRDKQEGPGKHPLLPIWPDKWRSVVEFCEEAEDQTRVTVTGEPVACTADELKQFLDHRGSMTQGWTGSFDKLEEMLAAEVSKSE
jgi:uncharacterized protein YndB with AHSA1/START domain